MSRLDTAAAVGAIQRVLEQAYAALEFPPGAEPNWDRFNDVFHPAAVLALRIFPRDPAISVLGLQAYAEGQMGNGLGEQGYSETPGVCHVVVVGATATARQEFTMNFKHGRVAAVDNFSLAWVNERWLVVAVVSDLVDPP